MSFIQVAALLGSLASSVAAHGFVSGIVAGGVYYEGYNPSFQYQSPPPNVIGWSDPADLSNGFVQNINSADIICHLNATNAKSHAVIAAGDDIEFQWTVWPESHKGPVFTYLANCNGACETADKTALEFFKIDAVGLINDATVPGTWASDQLIANNNSWVSQIPTSIAPGNYVVRHEILALHSAGTAGGAQFYPQCMNLQITGSGTAKPAGVAGEQLYSTSAPGVLINIYTSLSTYDIPGPSIIAGATPVASQTAVATKSIAGLGVTGSAGAAPAAAAATTAAVSSAVAVTATSAAASSSVTSTAANKVVSSQDSIVAAVSASTSAPAISESSPVVSSSASAVLSGPAAASSSAVASSISSIVAPVASLTAALPSAVLTSVVPTAIPTQTPGAFSGNVTLPTKALPEGMTMK